MARVSSLILPGGPAGASVSVSQATDVNGAIAAAESAGAGASFLATAVKESGGDLNTLRERLLGALTLVDQMLAFSSPPPPPAVAAPSSASSAWEAEYAANPSPPPVPAPAASPPAAAPPPPRAPMASAQQIPSAAASTPASGGYAAQLAAAQAAKASGGVAAPPAPPVAAAAAPAPAPAPVASTSDAAAAPPYDGPPVPLPESAIERMRVAMALLVKHRGGGPFGAGRLSQEDVPNLESALTDVLDVIKQVSWCAKGGGVSERRDCVFSRRGDSVVNICDPRHASKSRRNITS